MPFRKYIQLSIMFTDAVGLEKSHQEQSHFEEIRLFESHDPRSSRWEIEVSEMDFPAKSNWSAKFSADESEQFTNLVNRLPAEDMRWEAGVMDGSETDMTVYRKNNRLSFHWEIYPGFGLPPKQPPPWEGYVDPPGSTQESWTEVGALVDFIEEIIKKHKPSD